MRSLVLCLIVSAVTAATTPVTYGKQSFRFIRRHNVDIFVVLLHNRCNLINIYVQLVIGNFTILLVGRGHLLKTILDLE